VRVERSAVLLINCGRRVGGVKLMGAAGMELVVLHFDRFLILQKIPLGCRSENVTLAMGLEWWGGSPLWFMFCQ